MAAKLSGGGKRKFVLGQNSDINVTPFVDVMLVLLIIFMVALPPATASIKLDLPPAKKPTENEHPKPPVVINLQANGGLFIGETASRLATLPGDLGKILAAQDPTQPPTQQRV